MQKETIMDELSDLELLEALGVKPEQKKKHTLSAAQERVIAGFEDIVRFFEEHNRLPQHGEDRDIFERLYAVRLDQVRKNEEWMSLLSGFDEYNLLDNTDNPVLEAPDLDDDTLLDALGVETLDENSLENLRHVRPRAEIRNMPDVIASRKVCEDFGKFKPLFEALRNDLANSIRITKRFGKNAEIKCGEFFILNGQMVYVDNIGEPIKAPNGDNDARLRVVYDNGTESDILLRSLQRALYKDDHGRRITEPASGPLFDYELDADDLASGTLYVLRSDNPLPYIVDHRDIIHKIGVTGGDVKKRIANARFDPTYLMADVEVITTYQLYNIHRTRLEKLLHKIFAKVQFDITIPDRFGNPVRPEEWFLVPLPVIDEVVSKIKDGTITHYQYDPEYSQLKKIA